MKHSLHSRLSSLAALVSFALVGANAHADNRDLEAGPIWNNAHATRVCPGLCSRAGATWTRQWTTTIQGRMSVCQCAFPDAPPPVVTPPVVVATSLQLGRYNARHPHWSGFVTLNADGTYARENGDPGTWTFDGTTLVLRWRNWGPETLTRQPDGSFRAASNGFTLVAAEAAPVVPTPVPNGELIVNGGFEQPAMGGGNFRQLPSIPGWRLAAGVAIEVQNRVAGSPAEGAQHVELAAEAPTSIYQEVSVSPGATYELSFAYSPRPGVATARGNAVEVWIDGVRAMTMSAPGEGLTDTRWMRVSLPVRAARASLRVEFRDASDPDTVSGYIDDVSLRAAR